MATAAPFRARAVCAVLGGAILGGAGGFVSSALGSWVYWSVYHVSTAAQSWEELWIVSWTNALWMTVEGATTAYWLVVWAALRMRGAGSGRRLFVVLCLVVLNIASQQIPGLVMASMRAPYVVALHEAFSLTLGGLDVCEPSSRRLSGRLRWALLLAAGVGLAMGLLLAALGNEPVVFVGNFFYWTPCAFAILAGAHGGMSLADHAWGGASRLQASSRP